MIDLHAHFLPGIDDGAADASESVKMIEDSREQGVSICVGTPHVMLHKESSIRHFLERREKSIAALERAAANAKVLPQLLYGAEIYLDNDVSEFEGLSELCITGTRLLLVEFPTGKYDVRYSEWLYSLNFKGFTPIVAHFERYPFFDAMSSDLEALDIVYQTNAKTVLRGSWRKKLARMDEEGKCIVVSGDMHNMRLRKSHMKKAFDKTAKADPDFARRIFCENGDQLLNKIK